MKNLFRVLRAYIQTKYLRAFTSREKLESYQQKRLNQFFKFLKNNSNFYSKFSSFEEIPLMSKKLMMDNFNDIVTLDIDRDHAMDIALKSEDSRDFSPSIGEVAVGLSSGTSGNRGMFLVSEKEKSAWVGTILAKVLPSSLLSKQRIGLFLRSNNNLYESLNSNKIKFNFFDLIKPIDTLVDELQQFDPTILVSPPSMLRMIAQKVEAGDLSLNPIKIISAAEVLDPIDELYISRVFKQKVHQLYQCTEGFLGYTCKEGTIHLNEDYIYIEKKFINAEKTKFFPIITDLARTTQPIVRYELNDILTLKEGRCSCGSAMTAIEQIEGREDDIFYFKGLDDQLVSVFPDFIRRRVISSSSEITEYKIVQNSPSELIAYIESQSDIEDKLNESFKTFFDQQDLKNPTIIIKPYELKQSLNKMKRIESLYEK